MSDTWHPRPARDPERVRRVQELRRSSAASPHRKRPSRPVQRRRAIAESVG